MIFCHSVLPILRFITLTIFYCVRKEMITLHHSFVKRWSKRYYGDCIAFNGFPSNPGMKVLENQFGLHLLVWWTSLLQYDYTLETHLRILQGLAFTNNRFICIVFGITILQKFYFINMILHKCAGVGRPMV